MPEDIYHDSADAVYLLLQKLFPSEALPSMSGGTEKEQKKRSRISTEKDYAKSE